MTDKESCRSVWQQTLAVDTVPQWGKAAEKLRNLPVYREAVTVFAAPDESLLQVRINCLVDGKNLVMPAPSIRAGFYLLPARTVPFRDIPLAVTYKGLTQNGLLLKSGTSLDSSVGLLLTDSLAVDHAGGRLGDGQGFFDLCGALLAELKLLQSGCPAYTVIGEKQLTEETLPQDKWDIKMTGAITPTGVVLFDPAPRKPQIFWDMLTPARIKKISPLWKFFQNRQSEG